MFDLHVQSFLFDILLLNFLYVRYEYEICNPIDILVGGEDWFERKNDLNDL